jgi:hypothetical protein
MNVNDLDNRGRARTSANALTRPRAWLSPARMSFSGISQFIGGGQPSPTDENGPAGTPVLGQQLGLDSITLGQLRAMVGSAPKPKVCHGSMQ